MTDIFTFPGVGYDCNSYLIADDINVLIDTGTGTRHNLKQRVMEKAVGLDLIINTHAHLDHVGGNSLFSAEVAIHKEDVRELENGRLYETAKLFELEASSQVDRVLEDDDIIETGELNLRVIHTPGHTPGSICLHSDHGHLFSGDTLFTGGSFGRTDLPGGSARELLHSLERLKNLDFKYLMPGHMQGVKEGKKHLEAALEYLRI